MRAIVQPTAEIRLAAGAYNADPDAGKDRKHGVDFVLNPQDGVLALAEAGYGWNQAEDDAGLPGNVTIGVYYHSSDFDPVDGNHSDGQRDGNYGFYLLLTRWSIATAVSAAIGHRLQRTPWIYVTPDFQYVIRPNGQSDIDDAAVFAGRSASTFDLPFCYLGHRRPLQDMHAHRPGFRAHSLSCRPPRRARAILAPCVTGGSDRP